MNSVVADSTSSPSMKFLIVSVMGAPSQAYGSGDVDLADRLADDPGGVLPGPEADDRARRQLELLAVLERHGGRAGQDDEDLVDLDVGGGAGAHLPHADLDTGHRGQRTRAGLGRACEDGRRVQGSGRDVG